MKSKRSLTLRIGMLLVVFFAMAPFVAPLVNPTRTVHPALDNVFVGVSDAACNLTHCVHHFPGGGWTCNSTTSNITCQINGDTCVDDTDC